MEGVRTKEVSRVLAVAEPAGGLAAGVVDAVVGEVGSEKSRQMVVVTRVRQ